MIDFSKINSPLPITGLIGPNVNRVPLGQALQNVESALPKHQGHEFKIPGPERKEVTLPMTPKQGR